MADDLSFLPDQEEPEDLSFLPDQPKTVTLPGPGPVSSAPSPLPFARDPGNVINAVPGAADESGRPTPTISAGVPQPALVVYEPSEEDLIQVLSKVKPEELELARQVLQRDVKTREDLNLLQGKLSSFGEKHGFGFTADLVENLLNPLTIPEIEMIGVFGHSGKVASFAALSEKVSPARMKQVIKFFNFAEKGTLSGYFDRVAARKNVAMTPELLTNPTEFAEELSLAEKRGMISAQLTLPDDIGNMTPNDPLGAIKKRLALPGEIGAEIIKGDRVTPNDPMGMLPAKTYRVVPVNTPVPDYLVKDVTPEGARNLAVTSDAMTREFIEKAFKPSGISGDTASKKATKKAVDLIRTEVMQTGDDMALMSETKRATMVETRDFGDPEAMAQALQSSPLTSLQKYWYTARKYWMLTDENLKYLNPLGKRIQQMSTEAQVVGQYRAGRSMQVLHEVRPMIEKNPEWVNNLVDVFEGKAMPVSEPVRKAALIMRAVKEQIASEAKEGHFKVAGIEGQLRDFVEMANYYPHVFDLESLAKVGSSYRDITLKHLEDTGKMTRQEAVNFLDKYVSVAVKRQGNLEKSRLMDFPGYSRDVFSVFDHYVHKAFERIETARQFGVNNEKVGLLIKAMPDQFSREIAEAAVQRITGMDSKGAVAHLMSQDQSAMSKFIIKRMMPLAALTNSPQGVVSAWVRNGLLPAVNSARTMFKGMRRSEAKYAGVLLEKFTDSFESYSASSASALKRGGFTATEEYNRILTQGSEEDYIKGTLAKLLRKNPGSGFLRRELDFLNLDAETIISRGYFTPDEIKKGAIASVRITQGSWDPASTPLMMDSGWGKTIYRLKSFDLLYFRFARQHALEEAKHGNFTPFLRLTAGGIAVGEAGAGVWAGIKGVDRPDDLMTRLLEDYSYGSSLGIMSDIASGTIGGSMGIVERVLRSPDFAVANESFDSVVDLLHGKPAKLVGNTLAKRVAVPFAVNTVGKALGPVGGFAAGVATRAMSERLKKFMQEKQSE